MIEILSSGLKNAKKCEAYRSGKCPIRNSIRKLLKDQSPSLEEATSILRGNGLPLRNHSYGVDLLPIQVEEAGKTVVTADCPIRRGKTCSVLIRESESNSFPSQVIGVAWRVEHLPHGKKNNVRKIRV